MLFSLLLMLSHRHWLKSLAKDTSTISDHNIVQLLTKLETNTVKKLYPQCCARRKLPELSNQEQEVAMSNQEHRLQHHPHRFGCKLREGGKTT